MFSVFASTVFCTSFARPSCCVSGSKTVFGGGGGGSGLWCDEHPKMDMTASETAEIPKLPIAIPPDRQLARTLSVQSSTTISHSEIGHDSFRVGVVVVVDSQCLRRGVDGRYRHGGEAIPGRGHA